MKKRSEVTYEGKVEIAGKVLRPNEVSIRIIAPNKDTVLKALSKLQEIFNELYITGCRPNNYDLGWRAYCFVKLEEEKNE